MFPDFIANGQAHGGVAQQLLRTPNMDVGVLRPWIGADGQSYVTLNSGRSDAKGQPIFRNYVTNAPATLLFREWIAMDDVILRAAEPQLRVWGDIVNAGLTYNVPNGMATVILQHQTASLSANATLSIDGLREAERDRPVSDMSGLPLPIVHSDFSFSLRELLVSRQGSLPLDTTQAAYSTRKITELVEKLTLGTLSSYTYGGYTIYGLTNHPARETKTLTLPTAGGWNGELLVNEIGDMIQTLQDNYFNGPYGIWYSPDWTKYLNRDYSSAYAGDTILSRLRKNEDIRFWNKADYLSGFTMILVQLTPDVIRAVTGMNLQTLQWEAMGGLMMNFKIMGIMVPQLRTDPNGNLGVVHGVAA